MKRVAVSALILSCCLAGCSTRPREFRATLSAPVSDQASFAQSMRNCQVMARGGVRSNFGTTAAQAGAGTAGGFAAAFAASAATTSSTSTSLAAGVGAGGAALTLIGPLVGFGVSRAIRSGREKKYKAALGQCLSEFGYTAAGWEKQKRLSKAERAEAIAGLGKAQPGESREARPDQSQQSAERPPLR